MIDMSTVSSPAARAPGKDDENETPRRRDEQRRGTSDAREHERRDAEQGESAQHGRGHPSGNAAQRSDELIHVPNLPRLSVVSCSARSVE
jgi:hypothetical protein